MEKVKNTLLYLLRQFSHAPLYNLVPVLGLPMVLYQAYWRLVKKSLNLRNRVVLVTGANSGLGKEISKLFYRCGCHLILAGRNMAELESTRDELRAIELPIRSGEVHVVKLDLSSSDEEIAAGAAQAMQFRGQVDILVNNAGVTFRGSVGDTAVSVHRRVMQVNYFSHIALVKAILPSMVDAREGTIVCIGSVQGKISLPFRSAYSASKHAAQAFYDALRAEVADSGVKVLVVNPGYIRTNLSQNALTARGDRYGLTDKSTEEGYSAGYVAERVVEGVRCGELEITVAQWLGRLAMAVRAALPYLYFYFMSRRARNMGLQSRRTI